MFIMDTGWLQRDQGEDGAAEQAADTAEWPGLPVSAGTEIKPAALANLWTAVNKPTDDTKQRRPVLFSFRPDNITMKSLRG